MRRKTDKFFSLPEEQARAVRTGILVKDTNQFCQEKTKSLIWLPESDRMDLDKDGLEPVEVGEVISTGCDVSSEIAVGDVVLYRRITAYGMPNGYLKPYIWKIEWPFSVIAKLN